MELYRSKGTNAMVLGIVSCSLALLGFLSIPGLVCGIIGLVMASKIRKASKLEGFEMDGNSKAAYVLGIVGVCLNALMIVFCILAIAFFMSVAVGSAAAIGSGVFSAVPEIMDKVPAIIESIPVP